jgi:saccharopine dehydrogenase-like NADP-dependent oxidoreductase
MNDFLRLAREARERQALLVTGAGAAPAVTAALAGLLAAEFDRVGEINIFLTPGMDDERELATVRAVLERAAPRARNGGREARAREKSLVVVLPPPVGRRRGYRCDLPDLELFTKHFGARTVTARAGLAPGLQSALLALYALLRRLGWIERLSPFAALLVRLATVLTRADAVSAAICVSMRGTRRGTEQEHVACLIGRRRDGPAIAAAPIVTLVRQWLERGVHEVGAMASVGLFSLEDLKPELARHDVVLVRQ